MIYSIIDYVHSENEETVMARARGDGNLSAREQRLKAKIEVLKAENRAQKERSKAELKIKDARIRELKTRMNDRN
jgi:hypothetical protein